jgi:hypothetical protein
VRWSSTRSIANFDAVTGRDDTSSEQHLIIDESFDSDHLGPGEDDIDEEEEAGEEDEDEDEDGDEDEEEDEDEDEEDEAEREVAEDLGKDSYDLV